MKFEKIDGVQYVVLDKNDKICITTPGELEEKQIQITSTDGGLEISGNSSIVSSIRGYGMLEKVYIPPVVSSEEILEKCDKWINMFKQVHDTFKKLVLTDDCRKQDVTMKLSFTSFTSLSYSNDKGRGIHLDLIQRDTILKEGVTIYIDDANDSIYSYLVANVLDYYVSQNFGDQKIDSKNFDGILYSKEKHEKGTVAPIFATLGSLFELDKSSKIVAIIIGNHNIGESSEQLIANLRNKISNQQIGDRMDLCINFSSNQCEHILKKKLISKK